MAARDKEVRGKGVLAGRNWVNPYIAKLDQYPDRLFARAGLGVGRGFTRDDFLRIGASYCAVVLELGSGSGGHVIERARREPETLFIGFELRFKRAVRTIEKALRSKVPNLLIINETAFSAGDLIPPNSVDLIYVNFPDPWGREKWEKHRMLTREMLENLAKVAKSGAELRLKTDNRDFYHWTVGELKVVEAWKLGCSSADLHSDEGLRQDNVLTEFEQLFLAQKMQIYFWAARRE